MVSGIFITAMDARNNNYPRDAVVHSEARAIESEILQSYRLGFYDATINGNTEITNSSAVPIDVWTIDSTTSQLYIPNHGLFTGQTVTINSTITLPPPLTNYSYYYVIFIDDNHITLASSYTNAVARRPISITVSYGINNIATNNGGSGYIYPPAISFQGGSPTSNAIATATLSTWGNVITISNSTYGSNYIDQPTISINAVGSGAVAGAVSYQTVAIVLASGGEGYTLGNILSVVGGTGIATTATVISVDVNGTVLAIALGNPGLYSVLPTLVGSATTVSPAGGTGAEVTLTMGIAAIVVSVGGTDYLEQPVVIVNDSSGIGAVVTAVVQGGSVAAFIINQPGYGYVGVNSVTITSGSGTIATPVLQPASIGNVILTNNGGDTYTSIPTVTVSTVGSGATATTIYMAITCAEIIYKGAGYSINDMLLFTGGIITLNSYVRVLAVDPYGAVLAYVLESGGSYTTLPTLLQNLTIGGTGSGATFNLTAGVSAIALGSGGSGYVVPPDVNIDPPTGANGHQAIFRPVVVGGSVTAYNPITMGSSYLLIPNVTITNGNSAVITANLSPTVVFNVNVTNMGSFYTNANIQIIGGGATVNATANATIVGGQIRSINLISGGENYIDVPSVSIAGDGSGATAEVNLLPTYIASLTIQNNGGLYNYPPTLTIQGAATAIATLTATGIDYIIVNNLGQYYTSIPIIYVIPGPYQSGTPTSPIVSASLGYSVVSIAVNNPGTYASVPTVIISPPPNANGIVATATATIGPGLGTFSLIPYHASLDYYKAWQRQQLSNPQLTRPYNDRMDSIIQYFTNLGYTINRMTNPNTLNSIQWYITW